MPQLLFLLAFGVGVEDLKQVAALTDLSVSIGVDYLREVLHEPKVSSHCIREPCDLAKLRNESDLSACPLVLVNQEWLVGLSDLFIVAGLVVLFVGDLKKSH
jgi:hypothetical protein